MSKRIDDIYKSLKTSKKKYMVEIDMEGRLVGWSEDALELIGYTLEEMEELTVFDLVSDLDLLLDSFEHYECSIARDHDLKHTRKAHSLRYNDANGSDFEHEAHSSPVGLNVAAFGRVHYRSMVCLVGYYPSLFLLPA